MKREQIIKALECCFLNYACDVCPITEMIDCRRQLKSNILSLIKELTEEISWLQTRVNRLKKYDEERDVRLHARLIDETKADTVREMQERLKAEAYVPKPYGMSKVVDVGTIDRIAKEILNKNTEDENGTK